MPARRRDERRHARVARGTRERQLTQGANRDSKTTSQAGRDIMACTSQNENDSAAEKVNAHAKTRRLRALRQ